MASNSEPSIFQEIIDNFNDVDQLLTFAQANNLMGDPQIEDRRRQIIAATDYTRMIQAYSNPVEFYRFIERNNLYNDPETKERYNELVIENATNVEQLLQWAHANNLSDDEKVLNRMAQLIEASFCSKCLRKFPNDCAKLVHETNCQGLVAMPLPEAASIQILSPPPVPNPSFVCNTCNKSFASKRGKQVHQSKCGQPKTCIQCEVTFSSLSLFASHKCRVQY